MTASDLAAPRVILLDIEGTTTPVAFVYDTLFPYARDAMRDFIAGASASAEIAQIIRRLEAERAVDADVPDARGSMARPEEAARYALWLMDRDRKSPALKELQGLIWREGYRRGRLRSLVFDDVPPALARWAARGLRVSIYSSGSVLAQQLLFGTTQAGDLTPFIERYFDTAAGSKKAPASYTSIAAALQVAPADVLFVSDAPDELTAAVGAGMAAVMSARAGNPALTPPPGIECIHSFDELPF